MATLRCPKCGLNFEYTFKGRGVWNEQLPDQMGTSCVDLNENIKKGLKGFEAFQCSHRERAMLEYRQKLGR